MRTGTAQVLFGFFGALFVASQVNIILQLGPVAGDLLQLQLTTSPETFRGILEGWSPEDLNRYRSHFAWDSVHPLIYGGLLGLWMLVVHRERSFSPRGLRILLILALASSMLDYLENAIHLYLETNRESINGGTVLIAAAAAGVKWFCAALVTVLLTLASVRALLGNRSGGSERSAGRGAEGSDAGKSGVTKPSSSRSESAGGAAKTVPARTGPAKTETAKSGSASGTAGSDAVAESGSSGSKSAPEGKSTAIPKQTSRKKRR
ncbi:MAG TPA: hypothetical protein VFZ32_08895 [Micromonosporaceae bacterium]